MLYKYSIYEVKVCFIDEKSAFEEAASLGWFCVIPGASEWMILSRHHAETPKARLFDRPDE